MGVTLVNTSSTSTPMGNSDAANNRRGRTRKLNPTAADLPLPPGSKYQMKWSKEYLPQLYAWAGSINDPFGANGQMSDEVDIIWERIFPDIPLEAADKPTVLKVVRALFWTVTTSNNLGLCLGRRCPSQLA